MFEKFEAYLTQNINYTDYWYDDACGEASEMLLSFDENDWQKLTLALPNKYSDWQRVCFELVADDCSSFAQQFIIHFLVSDDSFLQYLALDTLNEHLFSNFLANNKKYLFKNILQNCHFQKNNDLGTQYLLLSVLKKLNQ